MKTYSASRHFSFSLRVASILLAGCLASLGKDIAVIMPYKNGQLRLPAAEQGGSQLLSEAMVWKVRVAPGVYNVMVDYAAKSSPPAVRLEVSDGRHLQDRFLPSPNGTEHGSSMSSQSLGPLAFQQAGEVVFRLLRADPQESGAIVIADVLLIPIGGTQPSVVKRESGETIKTLPPRTNQLDGAEMVFIPEGVFTMGGLGGSNDSHSVFLKGFWIYKLPVTVRQYRMFCESTARPMPTPPSWGWIEDHPMVNVSWYDSLAYTKWAGVRLPSEAEWEKAARGTDGRVLPWGNDFDTAKCQSIRDLHGFQGTAPVGYFPANVSPYGVVDMAGNVWQWCSTRIGANPYQADDGRKDIETYIENEKRVYRGGGWVENSWRMDWTVMHRGNFFSKYIKDGQLVELRTDHIGFRCAASGDQTMQAAQNNSQESK